MKKWLKLKLRRWLEIDENTQKINNLDSFLKDVVSIGVDVHFKEPHMILIYSRLNGGQIREVPAHFDTLAELNRFVEKLKVKYKTKAVRWDMISPYTNY